MNQTNKIAVVGTAAIVLGAVLALTLPGERASGDEAIPDRNPRATQEQRQARLSTPSERLDDTPAADYLEARWGHLGDTGEVTAHVDPVGNRYFVEKRIFVGRGRGGRPLYARAYAQAERIAPDAVKASAAGLQGARVTLDSWEPGPMSKLYKNVKHANQPEDLPEELQQEHPLHPNYEGPLGNQ